MTLRAIGIDPGLKGAIALYDGRGVRVHDMPTIRVTRNGKGKKEVAPALLAHVLHELHLNAPHDVPVLLEKVGAMPNQGVSSMFQFGRSVGIIEGALVAAGYRYDTVVPAVWRRAMGVVGDKSASRERIIELLPAQAGLFSRVKDDGRAEAALLAILAYRRSLV